ncbi:hypothetical protein C8R46DRAFT_1215042 [Mycena filopes]|nr:hypothetical protein C8R46DRAFT_1215042 [Mycena filopes]
MHFNAKLLTSIIVAALLGLASAAPLAEADVVGSKSNPNWLWPTRDSKHPKPITCVVEAKHSTSVVEPKPITRVVEPIPTCVVEPIPTRVLERKSWIQELRGVRAPTGVAVADKRTDGDEIWLNGNEPRAEGGDEAE